MDYAAHQTHSGTCFQKNEIVKRIAFFDFDGTITTKDSLLEFIKFYKGTGFFYFGFLLYSPYVVAYKLGIIPNYVAKQKVLQFFFKGDSMEQFTAGCKKFAQTVLPSLVRPKALKEIERLKALDTTIVVVSASAENWISDWTAQNGLNLIGTLLETGNGKITGKINGKNCYGDEKASRIKAQYNLIDYAEVYCYGDSGGDKAMLQLADFRFYKPFR